MESDRLVVGIADWLIHSEMGYDWLFANMNRFEKIRIYFNGKSTHIVIVIVTLMES